MTTQFAYDINSTRATLIHPLTETTSFSYDAVNRLMLIDYSGAVSGTSTTSDVSYTYDLDGNRHSMVDSATTSYVYDELDRLTSVTSPGSQTVGYRYDLDGNRRKLIYPDGMAVSYTLDAADRLQSLTDSSSSGTTSYTFAPDSRLAGVTNANPTTTTYTWDNARRLQDILHKDGTDTLSHHGFTLDPLGNRTHFDEQLPVLSAPGLADADGTLAAQRLPGTSADADLDELVAATADAVQPVAQGAGAQPNPPTAPGTPARPTREQPLQDSTTRADRPALFHAEPKGHTLDVFDKSSPTASVQVQHAWTKASIRFELPGAASQRTALGNKASAQVGNVGVTWTSFDDHLKEDLVLFSPASSNTSTFNVQMHGLAFAKDGHGGWILNVAGGLPRFELPAPTG